MTRNALKQKDIEHFWKTNPYRQAVSDPKMKQFTRCTVAGFMDIGFRCGWEAAVKTMKRTKKPHDQRNR